MPYTNYQIGLTTGSMIDLGTEIIGATLPAPKADPVLHSQYIQLADGSMRGLGWYNVEWNFGILTPAQRTILRTFCPYPYASYQVYIVTRTHEADAFARFMGWMIWPQEEKRDFLRRQNFVLKFNKLVPA